MNIAIFLADFVHVVAVLLLLGWIARNKSCKDISGKMQILNALLLTARYLDILDNVLYYLIFMKVFFLLTSYATIVLVYSLYRKTYEKEYDAFWIETLIVLCLGLGLLETSDISSPEEVLWAFSRYLEAVAVIPQIYFTYKKEVKSNIITYYIIALILYRFCYIVGWIIRYNEENHFDGYTVYPGLVQFAVYFAYFLLPRQPTTILPTAVPEETQTPVPTEPSTPKLPRTPNLRRQESLLETPFLKRNAASYSSIYTIGLDSKSSTPNGSVVNLRQEGRY